MRTRPRQKLIWLVLALALAYLLLNLATFFLKQDRYFEVAEWYCQQKNRLYGHGGQCQNLNDLLKDKK